MKKHLLQGSLALLSASALLAGGCNAIDDTRASPVRSAEQRPALGSDVVVYGDALATGWADWSWDTDRASVTSPVQSGTSALSVKYRGNWAGLELRSSAVLDGTAYTHVRFWIHGGTTGDQKVRLYVLDGAAAAGPKVTIPLQAGQWNQVDIALSSLGSPAEIKALGWQEAGGAASTLTTFYLDGITLVSQPPPALSLSVDAATAHRKDISPDIYGIDNASEALATALRLPVRRWGGNAKSRYNYQTDTTNTGSDWYFENVSKADSTSGSAADNFVQQDRRTSTKTLLTVPLIGWVAKDSTSCGYNANKMVNGVAVFPTQKSYDTEWRPHCGNGVSAADDTKITSGVAAEDTSVEANAAFVQGWVNHLVTQFGTAANGGVAYYNLDNEPMLWNDTHRDVHPAATTFAEVRDRTYTYAAAIKAADASAKTLGPVAYGWNAYFYSAKDWEVDPTWAEGVDWWEVLADRSQYNEDFVPWYLGQMKAYEDTNNVRILDYLDLHYYPETKTSGLALRPAGDDTLQDKRLEATRSLWDPYYVDDSWINQAIRLIPRMRDWVNQKYPHTKLAITEYNFGALDHLNGALAQAEVLGIFGREGLHLATLWWYHAQHQPTFEPHHPGAFAFKMYRNYDGAGGAFGEVGVKASSTEPNNLSVFAAERSDGSALTVMVVNKTRGALSPPLSLANFPAGASAQVFRYSAANLGAIVQEAAQPVSNNSFTATYPAQSITLFVIPRATN